MANPEVRVPEFPLWTRACQMTATLLFNQHYIRAWNDLKSSRWKSKSS